MMQGIRFVLVRPASAGNVGAVARALKNMDLGELWLVAPRYADDAEAERFAHGATDVLAAARRVPALARALADCRWCIGTTRRAGRRRGTTLVPRALGRAAMAEPDRRPLAVVFGPEEDGLGGADLALCQDVVRIPTAASQPSLNLAQAVLVVAYELYVASLEATAGGTGGGRARTEARAAELEGLWAHLEAVLLAVGFARRDTLPARMLALRRILGRARPTPGDVRILRGICRQVLWAARRV